MALSGSTNFSVNRNKLIEASMRLIGVKAYGENLEAEALEDASESLNMLIKAWQTLGLQLWTRKSISINLVASKNSYSLGPSGDIVMDRPLNILKVMRKDSSGNEVEVFKLSQDEYKEQTPKTTESVPVNYYYDPQLTNGVLHIWPQPDTTTAAEYTLEILYQKPFDDVDNATDDFEFPQEWYRALKYALAIELAPEYGLSIDERKQLYLEARPILKAVEDFDVEEGTSIYFQPVSFRR